MIRRVGARKQAPVVAGGLGIRLHIHWKFEIEGSGAVLS